jgi:hypothetical protein
MSASVLTASGERRIPRAEHGSSPAIVPPPRPKDAFLVIM